MVAGDVAVPGHPYRLVVVEAAHRIVVSVRSPYLRTNRELVSAGPTGLAVLASVENSLTLLHVVPAVRPRGMALSHDGLLLVARDDGAISVFPLEGVLAGPLATELGTVFTVDSGSTGMVSVSSDGLTAVASEERQGVLTVIDMDRVRGGEFSSAVIRRLVTDQAPVSVVEAPDGQAWYVTCQSTGRDPDSREMLPGTVIAFDPVAMRVDPSSAVLARAVFGNPVRLALSKDGRVAWVSSRSENRVLALDTERLLAGDPDPIRASIEVGPAPVGIALAAGGRLLFVSNSNRFEGPQEPGQTLSIVLVDAAIEGKHVVAGTIEVGAFPREVVADPTGRWIYVTNYGSKSVTMIDAQAVLEAVG